MATYLDFESRIESIQQDMESAEARGDEPAVEVLEKDLEKEVQKTYGSLNDYQKLQLARHPDRPYALDYIRLMMEDSYETGTYAFHTAAAAWCG